MLLQSRNMRAIEQYARSHGVTHRLTSTLATLERLLPQLGSQSHSRQAINQIGIYLLQDTVKIVAPSCPDYQHCDGKYTFDGVGRLVPLLAQRHIALLSEITTLLPRASVEIVVADQEVDDVRLCQRVKKTRPEFLSDIQASCDAVAATVATRGWSVSLMTTRFPDLLAFERDESLRIANNRAWSARIDSDTFARQAMYHKVGVTDWSEMRQRTIRTAAQYAALARIASRENFAVCNHDTVNLTWYKEYNAVVFHNPISIY